MILNIYCSSGCYMFFTIWVKKGKLNKNSTPTSSNGSLLDGFHFASNTFQLLFSLKMIHKRDIKHHFTMFWVHSNFAFQGQYATQIRSGLYNFHVHHYNSFEEQTTLLNNCYSRYYSSILCHRVMTTINTAPLYNAPQRKEVRKSYGCWQLCTQWGNGL